MKIDILSDLHVEFNGQLYERILKESNSEKIIIAGDIGPLDMLITERAFNWLANKYKEVIYVPGNHDYYGSTINRGNELLLELENKLPSLTVLGINKMTTIDNTKVIGNTLWVPFNPLMFQFPINDPFQIPDLYNRLDSMNKANKKFISDTLDENTILVTHHLPHPICIADQFKGEPTNIWFMSDESETLEEKKPKIAIFGHSHVRTDFVYKGTRYINNSVGYPSEYRPIKQLTFEV